MNCLVSRKLFCFLSYNLSLLSLCRASTWSVRPASLVSSTEQYRAPPPTLFGVVGICPKGPQQGIREYDLTHACTQSHTQNIRTHTVIGMCYLRPHRYLRGNFSHSTVPCLPCTLYLSSNLRCTWGLWVCACVMYPKVIIVCVMEVFVSEGPDPLNQSDDCVAVYVPILESACLEFCTCNLSHVCRASVAVGMSLSVCSIFFLIFLLTPGNLNWLKSKVSTTVCFPIRRIKQSSLHKEDHISHTCELKLRILLCSVFWAVFKMLYWRAEVKAWCVCDVCECQTS